MKQSVKIALIISGMTLAVGIGYLVFFRKDDDDDSKTSKTKPAPTKPLTPIKYSKHPKIKELKKEIDTIYLTLEDLENRNGVVVYKSSGKPVSYGLDQGVWILTQKKITKLKKAIESQTLESDVKEFGLEIVEKMQRDFDAIFDPKLYNYNTDWYKAFLKK
jgi:hypothetical protein